MVQIEPAQVPPRYEQGGCRWRRPDTSLSPALAAHGYILTTQSLTQESFMQRICCLETLARVCVSLCVIMASYVAAHATSSRTTPKAKSATSTCGTSNYDGSTAAVLGSSVPTRENSAAKTQASRPRLSDRVRNTEPAHIEAVLSRYAGMHPKPANLAQGVAHWDPPLAALNEITQDEDERQGTGLADSSYHKYGPALGLPALREALIGKLMKENGLDMTDQEASRGSNCATSSKYYTYRA